jgi:hypothetical protein
VLALLAVAACGRFGFDSTSSVGGDGGGGGGDGTGDAQLTGVVGPRWFTTFGSNQFLMAAGSNGEAVASADFALSIKIGAQTITAQGPYQSSVVARFARDGTLMSYAVLDATGRCDMRSLTMVGDSVMTAGLTAGGLMPTYGPCAISTGPQQPIGFVIDPQGNVSPSFTFVSSGANAQGWGVKAFGDGSLAMNGVYGSRLTIGSTALPAAPTDNGWFARVPAAGGDPIWHTEVVSTTQTWAGPMSTDGTDACLVGAYTSAATAFGTALTAHGSTDSFVARVDATGTPRFLRELGTSGQDSSADYSVIALPDGGCFVSLLAPGDLTIDGMTFLVSDGPGLLLHLDPTGVVIGGTRLPSAMELATDGHYVFGTVTVSAPTAFGGMVYTPQGDDVVIVQLDAADTPRMVGVVGGAGDQVREPFSALAVIAPDALAITVSSTGALTFAGQSADSGASVVLGLAVLGVAP